MPPDVPRRLEDLLDSAGKSVQPTHPGWSTLAQRLAQTPQLPKRRSRRWWWIVPAPVGIAAAVLVVLLGHYPPFLTISPGLAEPPPIKVERQDVELTILSVADTEGETLYMPIRQTLGQANPESVVPGPSRGGLGSLRPRPARKLTGQALVKDHRLILNVREGDNLIRFTDVAATIDPTSVRLVSDRPGTEVKEQNFEYDLATADALLKRYLDREITCIGKDGHDITGYLASYDDEALVLAADPPPPPGQKVNRKTESLARRELQAVRLEKMPEDLLVKPTLVWKVHAQEAGKHDATLTYLCGFIQWQADYVVTVKPGAGVEPDLLDIAGWVSLDNSSGASFPRAGLKLIAGDANRQRDPWAPREPGAERFSGTGGGGWNAPGMVKDALGEKKFVEKSFFEYHLYTLTAPSTLRDKQIKQLALIQGRGVNASRRYVYDPSFDNRRLAIELTAKNDKANHLGFPLPKGRVTVQQPDSDGDIIFLGRTSIDHTAVKEELTLKYGHAFDLAGEYRQVAHQQLGPRHTRTAYEMKIRNHQTTEARVRAIVRQGMNGKIAQTNSPYQKHDVETIYFDFALKPNAERFITYTVDYQDEGIAP